MKLNQGKFAKFQALLAASLASASAFGREFNILHERQSAESQVIHMKLRSGFTNSTDKKKNRNRKKYQMAFESRRRNRR